MKKFALILACIAVTTSLASCKNNQTDTQTPLPEQDNIPLQGEQIDAPYEPTEPQIDIRIKDGFENVKLDDGTVLFDANLQTVKCYTLSNRKFSECSKAINEQLNTINGLRQESAQAMLDALYDYISANDVETATLPWTMTSLLSVARNDGLVVSIIENITEFAGVDGVEATFGYNFDSLTAEKLSLKGLCSDEEIDKIETAIRTKLEDKYGKETFDGYTLNSTYLSLADDSWYFTDNGIKIAYNTTEVAPAIAGNLDIEFSKDELPEKMAKYFFD